MFDFSGKTALVTGGSRGIGRAIARGFAQHGAQVAICGRNGEIAELTAKELSEETGGTVKGYGADIAEPTACDRLIKSVTDELGPVTILVNNAGITRDGLLMRMKDDEWNSVLATNLTGAFNTSRAVMRDMLKNRWGRIVNLSSIVGVHGQAGQANYAAAKAGIIGFTKSLAQELASRNITANVVAPGYVPTDMTADLNDAQKAGIIERVPLNREGTTEEIANAVLFLASDAASYITGVVLPVDGGLGM